MRIITCMLVCLLTLGIVADVEAKQRKQKVNPSYGLARGFSNIMFGWLELPRGIIYENARIPVVGFVAGPIKGAALTAWREVAGVTDVMCMGLTREGLYGEEVPDFIWDADWIPACGEGMIPGCKDVTCDPCDKVTARRKAKKCDPCDKVTKKKCCK